MNTILIIFGILFGIFSCFVLYCAVVINAPRTKEEFGYRLKQDCAEFDKYIEEKRKKKLEKANKR